MTLVSEPPLTAAQLAGAVAVELDDDELVRRARAGDEGAFTLLADRHYGWLVARCRRHLGGDHHLAEDVAQESLLKAHDMLLRDDRPLRFRSWIGVVARNGCIDELRRRRPQPMGDFDEDVRGAVEAVDPGVDPSLQRAWGSLNRRYREVLFHRELSGLSYQEISGAMGTSVAAVETLLFRARAALRREYERAGGQLAGADVGVVLAAVAADPDRLAALTGGDPAGIFDRAADALATVPVRASQLVDRFHPAAGVASDPWPLGAAAACLALIGSLGLGLGGAQVDDPPAQLRVPEVAAPALSAPDEPDLPAVPSVAVPEVKGPSSTGAESAADPTTDAADDERGRLLRRLRDRRQAEAADNNPGPVRTLVAHLQRDEDEPSAAEGEPATGVDGDEAATADDATREQGPIRTLVDRLRGS